MDRNVVILDIDYVIQDEKPFIRLFSKDKNKNIVLIDDSFRPYLYVVPLEDIETTKKEINDNFENLELEVVTKKDFQIEKEFIKVYFDTPVSLSKNRESVRSLDSVKTIREFDIPFYRRYLMDNDIIPMTEVKAIGEVLDSFGDLKSENLEIIKLTEPLERINDNIKDFRILSFDLEVRNPRGMPNPEVDEIIMIGLASNFGVNKVISTKTNSKSSDFIEKVSSEKEMIESFVKTIKENNVDVIVGYNSDNFDFPYIIKRAELLDVPLDIGMDNSTIKFVRRGGYTEAASIKGLIHVDLYLVMRRYMSLDRYTLERVYLELFGEEKIDVPGERIWEFWDNGGDELDNLFDYSLDDVVATIKIAEQILPLNLELTRIVGQPLFDLSRMTTGTQAEWYLVKEAFFDNEIIPNKAAALNTNARNAAEDNEGGYVREPEKGLHENLVQFDFRSLYPSIIISKNISPDVLVLNDVDNPDDYNISPEHDFKFKKEPQGFIPSVIGKILYRRLDIKKAMKESTDPTEKKFLDVEQQALKRLINTMYGVYGFPNFRWYSFECAKAITSWGRQYIKMSIKKAEEYGFHTIYADTDGFYAKYEKE